MSCEEARPSLSLYLDSELSQAQASQIAGHLLSCGDCGAEYDALKSASRMVRDLPLKPLPAGFLRRLDQRRLGPRAPGAKKPSWFGPKPLAAAGAALLLAMVVAAPWRPPTPPAPGESLPPLPAPKRPEAKAGPTNEQMYKGLQAESSRLGVAPTLRDPEPKTQPFLGDRLGQPGTRAQTEASIRQFAAMRRSVEENSGKARGVPIAGSVAPVLGRGKDSRDEAIAAGQPLVDGLWSGDYAAGNVGTLTIEDEASWKALWRTLATRPAPAIDFATSQVVAVFLGPRPTGGYSVEFTEIAAGSHSLLVRYREHTPIPGQSPPDGATSPYALKAIPKNGLPARFEKVR